MMRSMKQRKGFTIIELITLIGALIALCLGSLVAFLIGDSLSEFNIKRRVYTACLSPAAYMHALIHHHEFRLTCVPGLV